MQAGVVLRNCPVPGYSAQQAHNSLTACSLNNPWSSLNNLRSALNAFWSALNNLRSTLNELPLSMCRLQLSMNELPC